MTKKIILIGIFLTLITTVKAQNDSILAEPSQLLTYNEIWMASEDEYIHFSKDKYFSITYYDEHGIKDISGDYHFSPDSTYIVLVVGQEMLHTSLIHGRVKNPAGIYIKPLCIAEESVTIEYYRFDQGKYLKEELIEQKTPAYQKTLKRRIISDSDKSIIDILYSL